MAAQFSLKETPPLPAAASAELVRTVARTPLSPARKVVLERYAQLARDAFKKPISA